MIHSSFVHHFLNGFDEVGTVLPEAIGHGVGVGLFFPGIVHSQTAAQIKQSHGRAFLYEVHINPRRFLRGEADSGNLGDLGSLMIVEHAQALQFAHGFQLIHHRDGL